MPNKPKYKEKTPPEDKLAYICGLIATDGSLSSKDRNSGGPSKIITLGLKIDDIETVKFVMKTVCTKRYVVKYHPKDMNLAGTAIFSAQLPKLYDYMVELGITPRKTHTLDVKLDDKSDEFKWYFLRGAIDGDGSVRLNSTLGTSSINMVSSSEAFLGTLKKIFGGSLNKTLDKRHNKYLYSLDWRGSNARQLLSKLPLDVFCMNRKTAKMLSILNFKPHSRKTAPLGGTIWSEEDIVKNTTPGIRYDEHPSPLISKPCFADRLRRGWSEYAALNTLPVFNDSFTKEEVRLLRIREFDV